MKRAFVVSDLHLFSQRTRAGEVLDELRACCAEASDLFLLGDIFDFKWSTVGAAGETAAAAIDWLRELCGAHEDCQFHFVLGNHDHHPIFVAELEQLAEKLPNLCWEPFYLRVGDAVFLHGDAANPRMRGEQLAEFREHLEGAGRPGNFRTWLYDWVLATRLHLPFTQLIFPAAQVVRRLTRYLGHLGEDGVKRVYFGHTHLAMDGRSFLGVNFYNGGAPIPGSRFSILEVELS